jgi:hypothetical protein
MSAPLREQIQMARINRTKRRVSAWWHLERCEACRTQRAAQADLGSAVSMLVQRVHEQMAEGEFPPAPTDHPKH